MAVNSKRHGHRQTGTLPSEVLADIVRRIVAVARPENIVLFGSAARGEMGAQSDVDLLVIKAGKYRRRRLAAAIYRGLRGADAAVDVVLVTPEEVARYRNTPCLVIFPAMKEGKVVYATKAAAAR
jgi:predicted nucleotidyltransferase